MRSRGKISSLPRSIAKERRTFAGAEYAAKLPIGPTSASPGPILLKHATVAVKFASKLKGSREIKRNITSKIMK